MAQAPGSTQSGFSPAYVNYVIALIFLVSAINVCDRTIVAVLVDDIRAELALNDRQMGVVMGFVMAVMASLLSGAWSAPVMATAQVLVPPQARAVSAAVWTTVAGFVGGSLGPLLIGDLNMRLQPVAGAESVRWSLAMVAVVPVLAAIAFARLARWMPSVVCVRPAEETS